MLQKIFTLSSFTFCFTLSYLLSTSFTSDVNVEIFAVKEEKSSEKNNDIKYTTNGEQVLKTEENTNNKNKDIVYNLESDEVQKHYIQKYDINGTFISSWGTKGDEDGEFLHVHGIAVDSKSNVYVTDEEKSNIQKFDSYGHFITSWGKQGNGYNDEFGKKIEDVNVDHNDDIFVVDYSNEKIMKFDENGNFILSWGGKGGEAGQFDRAWGVAFDSENKVYKVGS